MRLLEGLLKFFGDHVIHIDWFTLVERLLLPFNGTHVTRVDLNVLALGRALFVGLSGSEELLI